MWGKLEKTTSFVYNFTNIPLGNLTLSTNCKNIFLNFFLYMLLHLCFLLCKGNFKNLSRNSMHYAIKRAYQTVVTKLSNDINTKNILGKICHSETSETS